MEAVLYICHGSRIKEASDQAISFIKRCMENEEFPIQEYSFLELSEPTIEQAFFQCIKKGATVIHVIPVLLLTAAHAKIDIPEVLGKLSEEYPEIEIRYGRPIGVHKKMIEIVVEKIKKSSLLDKKDLLVLLVGRGSSDPEVKQDLGDIAALVEAQLPGISVKDCYLTAAEPSFIEGIEYANSSSYQNILVIPYLLFTGILMKSMKKTIKELADSDKIYELAPYLGYHPFIADILNERLKEVAKEDVYVSIKH
ncbi:sirohydrochlorin chelatase [Niallia sp. NCCP-28]|uniref:sirohydrochlorin chelatase n=1 Tax=Niallia sp. NCCP-28 TaxID=2934712 RepID=UPI0020892383|nr:sirohydrochlorin chelatase [Niallia sp. NCCP-28]GKU84600.1 cobalamin biosynthesis protein CbiX [Niallia sp. NCCP-28]